MDKKEAESSVCVLRRVPICPLCALCVCRLGVYNGCTAVMSGDVNTICCDVLEVQDTGGARNAR